jgi:hypothetical protein
MKLSICTWSFTMQFIHNLNLGTTKNSVIHKRSLIRQYIIGTKLHI